MRNTHRVREEEVNARSLRLHFSASVRQAFGDLEAAVHFSQEFSDDMRAIVNDWAVGRSPTLHDVLIAFPLIAEHTFRHIRATGDQRAQDAWDQLSSQINENGFAVVRSPIRDKGV